MRSSRQIPKDQIAPFLINDCKTILEGLSVIDRGAAKIALRVDDSGVLTGLITDGDLRRALIAGSALGDPLEPHIRREFQSVTVNTSRAEALDLMHSLTIEQLPIVDSEQKVVGLHLLNQLVKPDPLPNAALILAGGKGTRLGKLTENTPKPMLRVAGRPILERAVLHLVSNGIRQIFLSVNYLAETIEEHFQNGSQFGCEIRYLREKMPLGTGGPLALLKGQNLQHALLVMNGDLITEFDVAGLIDSHKSSGNSVTIGARHYSHQVPFGCLQLRENQVLSLIEKPVHQEVINAGIYAVCPSIIERVNKEFTPMTSVIENALNTGESVGAYLIGDWIDVGLPDQLAEARGTK